MFYLHSKFFTPVSMVNMCSFILIQVRVTDIHLLSVFFSNKKKINILKLKKEGYMVVFFKNIAFLFLKMGKLCLEAKRFKRSAC